MKRVLWVALTLAVPAAMGIALLLAMGAVTFAEGLTALLGAAAGALALAWIVLRQLAITSTYLDDLIRAAAGASAPPSARHGWILQVLTSSLTRLDRLWRSHLEDIYRARDWDKTALDLLPYPLILLDTRRNIARANRAARELLGLQSTNVDLSAAIRHPDVLKIVDAVIAGGAEQVVRFSWPGALQRTFIARAIPTFNGSGQQRAAMLTLEEVTELQRSQQMRDDFIANVSHELRTPLSTLLGFVETIQGPAKGDAEAQERFLAIMHNQASRMVRLVNDLLSLSRIEQNEHTPPSGEVDVASILCDIRAALEQQAQARKMQLRIEAKQDLPPVVGDRDELIQLFQNLIVNALKYGREGTEVDVVAALNGGSPPFLTVSVRDHGKGIAREHLPRLTERFYRIDTGRSRALGGTGLGLAIVKHVVNRHRGRLSIESEEGKGSVFTVHLPISTASAVTELS